MLTIRFQGRSRPALRAPRAPGAPAAAPKAQALVEELLRAMPPGDVVIVEADGERRGRFFRNLLVAVDPARVHVSLVQQTIALYPRTAEGLLWDETRPPVMVRLIGDPEHARGLRAARGYHGVTL